MPDAARQEEGGGAYGSRAKHDLPARPHDYAFAGIFILTLTLALIIAVLTTKIDVRIIRRSRRRRDAFHTPS